MFCQLHVYITELLWNKKTVAGSFGCWGDYCICGGGGGGGGDNTEVIRMELPWRGRCMKQGVWGSIHGILWYCTVCDWFGEQFSQNNCETPD